MYGYEMTRSPAKQKEFVEVVLSDATPQDNESRSDSMDTAMDNPSYQSYTDLSNEKKVSTSLFFIELCHLHSISAIFQELAPQMTW